MKKILLIPVFILVSALTATAQQHFSAHLNSAQEVPSNASTGRGWCTIVLNSTQTRITVTCSFFGLQSIPTMVHIHGTGQVGTTAPVLFNIPGPTKAVDGSVGPLTFAVTHQNVADMRAHLFYADIHTGANPTGEIRGQIKPAQTVYDVDGDGRSDATVYRRSNRTLYTLSSLDGRMITRFEEPSAAFLYNYTWDFDADGLTDPLLLRLNAINQYIWIICRTNFNFILEIQWGQGHQPAMADYNGDGRIDIAVFGGTSEVAAWQILESPNFQQRYVYFGRTSTDTAVAGDYDGDGMADPAVVRSESGNWAWYVLRSSDGQFTRTQFGLSATDNLHPLAPIDVDADGRQDMLVSRVQGVQRNFFILRSSDSQMEVIPWGLDTDKIIFGDYDGDGKTDIVARRNVGGHLIWFVRHSSTGQVQYIYWGIGDDQ